MMYKQLSQLDILIRMLIFQKTIENEKFRQIVVQSKNLSLKEVLKNKIINNVFNKNICIIIFKSIDNAFCEVITFSCLKQSQSTPGRINAFTCCQRPTL